MSVSLISSKSFNIPALTFSKGVRSFSTPVATFTENNTDNYFQFIVYDITNEETKKTSKPAVSKVGLEKTLEGSLAAGFLSFYDVKTKALLAQVTVANTSEEVAATMKMVREKASK